MRLGILGGTFDPVHYGHLIVAETCRQQLALDRVCFLPAGIPPHKQTNTISAGHFRVDMLRLAVSGYPEFCIDARELHRDGPSYTVETLTEYHSEHPEAELFFLMGADSLRELMTWKDPQEIARLAHIVACNRPGFPQLTRALVEEWVSPEIVPRVETVRIPGTDLSSSEMRARIQHGTGVRFMTPRAVEVFIQQNQLYASEPSS